MKGRLCKSKCGREKWNIFIMSMLSARKLSVQSCTFSCNHHAMANLRTSSYVDRDRQVVLPAIPILQKNAEHCTNLWTIGPENLHVLNGTYANACHWFLYLVIQLDMVQLGVTTLPSQPPEHHATFHTFLSKGRKTSEERRLHTRTKRRRLIRRCEDTRQNRAYMFGSI